MGDRFGRASVHCIFELGLMANKYASARWPVVRCVFTSCFDMLASIMRPYMFTSNKKHFMENVKECRYVNRQKSIRTRSGC